MMEREVKHGFDPIWDSESRILILGSCPSDKSIQQNFYYAHRSNGFWRLLPDLVRICVGEIKQPVSVEEKIEFLHTYHIALWDVYAACTRVGSTDSSIRNGVLHEPGQIREMIEKSEIHSVYANGKEALKIYHGCYEETTGIPAIGLVSSSGLAGMKYENKLAAWREVMKEENFIP